MSCLRFLDSGYIEGGSSPPKFDSSAQYTCGALDSDRACSPIAVSTLHPASATWSASGIVWKGSVDEMFEEVEEDIMFGVPKAKQ